MPANMTGVFWSCLAFLIMILTNEVRGQTTSKVATIDTSNNISWVEDFYVSCAIDMAYFPLDNYYKKGLNLTSPKMKTLLKGLAPSLLRVGGTAADKLFFNKPQTTVIALNLLPKSAAATTFDVDSFVDLTRSTGNTLLWNLNLAFRFGAAWQPSNSIEFLDYCYQKGYGENIVFELGNEPERFDAVNLTLLSAQQIATDFQTLRTLLNRYPNFANSYIVGPDVGVPSKALGTQIIVGVANISGYLLRGLTFHHYYFDGSIATVSNYLNASYFPAFVTYVNGVQKSMATTNYPNLDLWLGETSDAYNSGTVNVSDRYVSGFLWLDKLGLAAVLGVRVVMRQTLYGSNYPLINLVMDPNPDYWLTWLHNMFIGRLVFNVTLSPADDPTAPTTRAYAHCTSGERSGYPPGAVTFFALNVDPTNSKSITFNGNFNNLEYDQYVLTPNGPDGILSNSVNLNGVTLAMIDEYTLPTPNPVSVAATTPVVLQPQTFGYFVFPTANIPLCVTSETTSAPKPTTTPSPPTTTVAKPTSTINTNGFDCTGKTNGDYVNPAGCTSFIICSNSYMYEQPCVAGLYFDDVRLQCAYASELTDSRKADCGLSR